MCVRVCERACVPETTQNCVVTRAAVPSGLCPSVCDRRPAQPPRTPLLSSARHSPRDDRLQRAAVCGESRSACARRWEGVCVVGVCVRASERGGQENRGSSPGAGAVRVAAHILSPSPPPTTIRVSCHARTRDDCVALEKYDLVRVQQQAAGIRGGAVRHVARRGAARVSRAVCKGRKLKGLRRGGPQHIDRRQGPQ